MKYRIRPFIDWAPNSIGISGSLSLDRETMHSLEPGDKTTEIYWLPAVWLHIWPITFGIALRF